MSAQAQMRLIGGPLDQDSVVAPVGVPLILLPCDIEHDASTAELLVDRGSETKKARGFALYYPALLEAASPYTYAFFRVYPARLFEKET